MIKQESTKHQDIVQGGFLDTYHNLSYKAILGNLWVSEFCNQAEFVVKTDDDMFVDLYEVSHQFSQYLQHLFLNTSWNFNIIGIPKLKVFLFFIIFLCIYFRFIPSPETTSPILNIFTINSSSVLLGGVCQLSETIQSGVFLTTIFPETQNLR